MGDSSVFVYPTQCRLREKREFGLSDAGLPPVSAPFFSSPMSISLVLVLSEHRIFITLLSLHYLRGVLYHTLASSLPSKRCLTNPPANCRHLLMLLDYLGLLMLSLLDFKSFYSTSTLTARASHQTEHSQSPSRQTHHLDRQTYAQYHTLTLTLTLTLTHTRTHLRCTGHSALTLFVLSCMLAAAGILAL